MNTAWKMMRRSGCRVIAVAGCLATSVAAADVAEIANACDECHGASGVSRESDVPTIAGMSAFVLEDYLLTYQDEARPCHETEYRGGDTDRPDGGPVDAVSPGSVRGLYERRASVRHLCEPTPRNRRRIQRVSV